MANDIVHCTVCVECVQGIMMELMEMLSVTHNTGPAITKKHMSSKLNWKNKSGLIIPHEFFFFFITKNKIKKEPPIKNWGTNKVFFLRKPICSCVFLLSYKCH
jgi:hypothetical protein